MNILVAADIYGRYDLIEALQEAVKGKEFDVVVVPGEITSMFVGSPEFSQLDVALLVLQKLLLFRKPVFCLPGNHDPYEITMLFDEYGVNLQEAIIPFGWVKFMGWGGALTPFGTRFEPTETETTEFLTFMAKKITKPFIFVTHNPPYNTTLDALPAGEHIGSKAIREFILKTEPLVAISAHIEEAAGKDMLGKTHLFYPGPLTKGKYGILQVDEKSVEGKIYSFPVRKEEGATAAAEKNKGYVYRKNEE